MKIAIVVLSTDGQYHDLIQGIRRTWGSIKHPDIDIFYNYADRQIPNAVNAPRNQTILHDDMIMCGYADGIKQIHKKTMDCFEWLVNNKKYDYVFRCCCGSYVIQENLIKFLEDKPKTNFYSGIFGKTKHGLFCSGSGFFLSWDLVQLLAKNKKNIPDLYQDDVNIGAYLTNTQKIVPISGYRYDYGFIENIEDINCLEYSKHGFDYSETSVNLPKEHLGYNYHYHIAHSFKGNCFDVIHQHYLNGNFCHE